MEVSSSGGLTSIMNLPDDCLFYIFQRLPCGSDKESFGLTCHRCLHIQNSSRRSLQLQIFTQTSLTLESEITPMINSFPLYRLLNRYQQLESLSLSGCMDLPDSALTQLQHYGSKLCALHLDWCSGITDNGLALVASGCPTLTIISLYQCNISDFGLEILAKSCSALKDVDLSYCSLISDHGINALAQNCMQLRAVVISYCQNINGVGFKGCSETLIYLEAESCKLEPEGILGIISGGGLEYLSVSRLSWSIFGDGLRVIGSGSATGLKILNMRMCRTVSDESIMFISKGCPLLQEWNLALCHEVRVPGWKSIGLNCSRLERLHVNRCRNLCDIGLQALRNGCKRLSTLHLSHAYRISPTAIELFKCLRRDVEIRKEDKTCIAPNWAFH